MFRAIIPNMVNVLEQCIKDDDEENAAKIFEVFDTLLMLVKCTKPRNPEISFD